MQLMARLLRGARRRNFQQGQSLNGHFRGQCWICLEPVDAPRVRGGPPAIHPQCHQQSIKDRQRNVLGNVATTGAWGVENTTLYALMTIMTEDEQKAMLGIMENHDVLIVLEDRIKPRKYKSKPRKNWKICNLSSRRTFMVATQRAAIDNCY